MARHNTVMKKTSAPGIPQNFGTLIAKIPILKRLITQIMKFTILIAW